MNQKRKSRAVNTWDSNPGLWAKVGADTTMVAPILPPSSRQILSKSWSFFYARCLAFPLLSSRGGGHQLATDFKLCRMIVCVGKQMLRANDNQDLDVPLGGNPQRRKILCGRER